MTIRGCLPISIIPAKKGNAAPSGTPFAILQLRMGVHTSIKLKATPQLDFKGRMILSV